MCGKRTLPLVLLLASLATGAFAQTSGTQTQPGARKIYTAALRCFVANGHVHNAFEKAGDRANADLFEKRAKQSHDLAYFWGDWLKLDQASVERDLNSMMDSELPKLVQNGAYLGVVAKDCKALGLM